MRGSSRQFAQALLDWYCAHRRDLPWRSSHPDSSTRGLDPYHVLVSEAMLQQTQVATVIPYFHRFLSRFPTLADLARSDEHDVLLLWQGLGYYARARNLRRLAQVVMQEHAGAIPADPEKLLALPGIGRYTAGAIASIAFDRRVPIVDGNVARVLCRIDKIRSDVKDRRTIDRLWTRAAEILPEKQVGDFNSALMELGATICTPRSPHCPDCPVRRFCEARAANLQDKLPKVSRARPIPTVNRFTCCIQRRDKYLIEQRPPIGRWAGMWQFPTFESPTPLPVPTTDPRPIGIVRHSLSHRHYHFEVFHCRTKATKTVNDRPRVWVSLDEIIRYPLSKPHLKIAEILRSLA